MDPDIRIEDDEYQPSSSDDEYDENEKRLLAKYKNSRKQDSGSETEVLGLNLEDDSDDGSDLALSDVEGQEEDDDLPDVRAWGKEKKKYYGTDYVDQDYGGFDGKDAQAAEIEELEAKSLQNQLVQQLDENDFNLDFIFKKKEKPEVKDFEREVIKTDLSQLTNKQKLQILQKESPELFGLIEDLKVKLQIARLSLKPTIEKTKKQHCCESKAAKFVESYYILILNYATNIYMYLLLKASKQLNNHPIIKTLYQYRQLLSQMDPVFEDIIKPQLHLVLEGNLDQKVEKPLKDVKKFLKILSKNIQKGKKSKSTSESDEPMKKIKIDNAHNNKKVKFAQEIEVVNKKDDVEETELPNKDAEQTEVSKRGITYQIAKNKGLTPHRKKEFRNPRVKHKLKYRKALIRRKGAVREPRKELTRYAGEISGIKASLSKSIKIKS